MHGLPAVQFRRIRGGPALTPHPARRLPLAGPGRLLPLAYPGRLLPLAGSGDDDVLIADSRFMTVPIAPVHGLHPQSQRAESGSGIRLAERDGWGSLRCPPTFAA